MLRVPEVYSELFQISKMEYFAKLAFSRQLFLQNTPSSMLYSVLNTPLNVSSTFKIFMLSLLSNYFFHEQNHIS